MVNICRAKPAATASEVARVSDLFRCTHGPSTLVGAFLPQNPALLASERAVLVKPISTGIICHPNVPMVQTALEAWIVSRLISSLSKMLEISSVPPTKTLENSSDPSSSPSPKERTSRSNAHHLLQLQRRHFWQDGSRIGSRVRPCCHPPQRRRVWLRNADLRSPLQNRRRSGEHNRLLPQSACKFTSSLYRRRETTPAYFHHTATNHANRTSFACGGLTTNLVRITLRVNLRRTFAPCKVRAKDWERNATGIHHHAA